MWDGRVWLCWVMRWEGFPKLRFSVPSQLPVSFNISAITGQNFMKLSNQPRWFQIWCWYGCPIAPKPDNLYNCKMCPLILSSSKSGNYISDYHKFKEILTMYIGWFLRMLLFYMCLVLYGFVSLFMKLYNWLSTSETVLNWSSAGRRLSGFLWHT